MATRRGGNATESTSSPSEPVTESVSETASEPSDGPTETSTAEGQVIDIEVTGDQVVPNGERVDVEAGEEVTLRVTADAPGEIHVHSTPEQELGLRGGQDRAVLTIDQPGVVEVESHDLGLVIVQLEVR